MPLFSRAGFLFTRPSMMRASDALATDVLMYAIPLLVLTTTGSASLTGVAFLLEWLPRLVAFTVGGPLVDRFRADRVFRAASTARALLLVTAALALALLPGSGVLTTTVVMAVGALSGFLAQASFVGVETIGAEVSRAAGHQAHRVQSVQIGIDQGALLVGPLLGGLLLLAGPVFLLVTVGCLSLTSTFATAGLSPELVRQTAPVQSVAASLGTGWRTVCAIPALAWLVAGLSVSNFATGLAQASAPISVMHNFGASSLTVGAIWSAAGLVALTTVAASRRLIDRFGLWAVGAAGATTACVSSLGVALAPELNSYAVTIGVMMAGEGALTVVLRTLRARLIPPSVFGSTLSVTIVLIVLPMPIAGALVAVLPVTSLPTVLLACAVVQGIALALAFRGLRRHRASYTLPSTPDTPLAPLPLPAPADAREAA
ncbi:MFS transporter [Streptomyces sp. NPDC050204]|uniref:MFS transporter n=1 Tax=Streptomyces sp. NPDC050204 TaxID=3155514 RepID=UPI00343690AC